MEWKARESEARSRERRAAQMVPTREARRLGVLEAEVGSAAVETLTKRKMLWLSTWGARATAPRQVSDSAADNAATDNAATRDKAF